MTPNQVKEQLEGITFDTHFASRSAQLVDAWSTSGAGVEVVEAILRYMEEHPSVDFGAPGPLVHFVESFYRQGYEEQLIASVKRRPTPTTVSMLNAIINGTIDPMARQAFIGVMRYVRTNPLADQRTIEQVNQYLQRLS